MLGRQVPLALLVLLLASGAAAPAPPVRIVTLTPPPGLPAPATVSEPHLAIDPSHPSVLVAAAQTTALATWRSVDGGEHWQASLPPAGKNGMPSSGGGDPVVAVGADGATLLGGVAIDPAGRCTLLDRIGAYRLPAGSAEFDPPAAVSRAVPLPRHFFGTPPVASCPIPRGLTQVTTNDKPWLTVDTTRGSRRGWVYVVWSRYDQTLTGKTWSTLYLAVSRDGGRTYGAPIVIAPRREQPGEVEHYSQVAVRPDGTLDVVWNEFRAGRTSIVHRASRDGAATFGARETITVLPRGTTPVGLVSALAVSPTGKLGLCWSQSTAPKAFVGRILCAVSAGHGAWSKSVLPFGAAGRQYLPAVTFQGARLWVAGYRSTAQTTRVLVSGSADGTTFDRPILLAKRQYGRGALCAPHPPDCGAHQRFVGDYIGAAAAPGHVWVDFVLPAAGRTSPNHVYLATIATG
jgi:hypothetical protein